MSFEIIDNFLSEKEFTEIKNIVINPQFPLYYSETVANNDDSKNFYFLHKLYDKNIPLSEYVGIISSILNKVGCKSLIRSKVNCFPRTENLITYGLHVDYDFPHKGVILYLNNCNGGTYVGDEFIQSKENRVLMFDSSKPHKNTNCTDAKCRFNIVINYF
jgi:hypothetical protein|tara:strand:+ start:260 stop:739 length:480 start_codon:yes stop_codon:yes gene_type:complete